MNLRWIALGVSVSLAGCGGEAGQSTYEITRTRTARVPTKRAHPRATSAQRFLYQRLGTKGHTGHRRPVTAQLVLDWKVPTGWKELGPTNMRKVNLRVAGRDDAHCYVTPPIGGSALANINRWLEQMGKPKIGAKELAKLPRKRALGISGTYLEIDGSFQGQANQRLVGLILPIGQQVYYVKMTGPKALLEKERGRFEEFLGSLRFKRAGQRTTLPRKTDGGMPRKLPKGHPPIALPDHAASLDGLGITLTWKPPQGWGEGPRRRMRLVSFVKKGQPELDMYLTVLKPLQKGGVAENINRWRGQLGLPGLAEEEVADLPTIGILGERHCRMIEATGTFKGMTGQENHPDYMLRGAIVPMAKYTLYIKMVGPKAQVAGARQAFISLCSSLRAKKDQ